MCDDNKIRELFHYFNIGSDFDSVYGEWAVAKNGDIINYVYSYAIFAIHHNDCDWIDTVKSKVWYNQESEMDFVKALERAKFLISSHDRR